MNTSLRQFDSLIASRSLLKHPFYIKWSNGELTLGDMRVYAKEYFHLAKSVPGVVSRVRDRALERDSSLASRFDKHIEEEVQHIELWMRFAKSLGVSEEELTSYHPCAKVRGAVEKLESVAESGFEEGVAAVYALERELPEIARTKKDGLRLFYGLEDADAHIYFDEHLHEQEHLDVWLSLDLDLGRVTPAVETSLDAQNEMLDAVCEVAGICGTC